MPPPASHWHPTEFLAVLTSPDTRVCSAIVWSVTPPHSGTNGPCVTPCAAGGPDDSPGDVESEPEEHAANTGIRAAMATASRFSVAGGSHAHTVAAATQGQPERHADLPFQGPNGISANPRPDRSVCESSEMLLALLRQYVRPYRGLLAAVAVLQVISTLASLYLPTVNAAIIDDGVAKGDTGTIVELGGMMLGRHRAAGAVRDRGGVLRLARRHGLRARPAIGDLPPRDRLLRRARRHASARRRC